MELGLRDHATLTINNYLSRNVNDLENSPWLTGLEDSRESNPLTVTTSTPARWPLNNEMSFSRGDRDETSGCDLITLGHTSEEASSPRSTQLEEDLFETFVNSVSSPSASQIQRSPSQSHLENLRFPEQSSSGASVEHEIACGLTKKRKGSDLRTHSQKGKRRKIDLSSSGYSTVLLRTHISREKSKYQDLGTPCPLRTFPSPLSEIGVPSWCVDYETELATFFFAIGSSESLAIFQDIIRMYRSNVLMESKETRQGFSNAERVRTIERLDGNISYFQFLKRCHIHALFLSSGASDQQVNDNFVVETTQSATKRKTLPRGNPFYIANAQLTTSIMKEIYPNLEKGDAGYVKKYRFITALRQLGQRLHLLVDRFGLGVIGLIPLAPGTPNVDNVLSIDDRMYIPQSFSGFFD